MAKRRLQDGEAISASARGTGQVDDQRTAADAGDAAGQESVGGLGNRVGPKRFGDPGSIALDHAAGRLGRHVPWAEAGATGREDELRLLAELREGVSDHVGV